MVLTNLHSCQHKCNLAIIFLQLHSYIPESIDPIRSKLVTLARGVLVAAGAGTPTEPTDPAGDIGPLGITGVNPPVRVGMGGTIPVGIVTPVTPTPIMLTGCTIPVGGAVTPPKLGIINGWVLIKLGGLGIIDDGALIIGWAVPIGGCATMGWICNKLVRFLEL